MNPGAWQFTIQELTPYPGLASGSVRQPIFLRAVNADCVTLAAKWRWKRWRLVLSAERKIWLEARYEVWGLDRVREELERAERDLIAHPDVTGFAQAWIETKETSQRRARRSIVVLVIVGIVQLGVAPALILEF